jgi:dihydroxy-acid dehydratase
MRSDKIKRGVERAGNRALLYATGLTQSDLAKPFIGICTSFTDLIPGHIGMRRLERFIERGVCAGGGVPFIFGVPGICDGIAMGHSGMKYSLPSRELIADMVETIMKAHSLDGLVCLTNCDKITPGMLMAIARLNVPAIVVTAGPMLSGRYGGRRLSLVKDTFEAVGRYKKGEISQQELNCLEMEACPGFGACQGLYTANSMACIVEAMGMSLPGCATALAVSAKKDRISYESGQVIVNLARRNIFPRTIMRKEAIENAIIVDMAMGGSSNTVLHLKAIANELGIDLPLKEFDRISCQTPHIVDLLPSGEYFMEDLDVAGGIPAVLKRLQQRLRDVDTVSGKKISKIARENEIYDNNVIRPLNNPYHKEGGMAILYGNLAPDGAVVKQSAVNKKMLNFKGKARVFDSEESAMQAIMNGRIHKGEVIVIRYEGPKGGPGMREMLSPTSSIVGMGLSNDVALITDGRFSGGTKGPCIGHISPEAAIGGPLAAVKEGDTISIDIPKRKLELRLSEREIKNRLSKWAPPKPSINEGYLQRYAETVTQASEGAVLRK